MNIIRTRGRIQLGLRTGHGIVEAVLFVNGVDMVGGVGITPMAALSDLMKEFNRERTDPAFLSRWPKREAPSQMVGSMPVAPVLERVDVPEPIFHRSQPIAVAAPMKPMRLGEVGAQLNRDAESYKKRRHATDLKTRQAEMAARRHPNRRVVTAVRAAASASSN